MYRSPTCDDSGSATTVYETRWVLSCQRRSSTSVCHVVDPLGCIDSDSSFVPECDSCGNNAHCVSECKVWVDAGRDLDCTTVCRDVDSPKVFVGC